MFRALILENDQQTVVQLFSISLSVNHTIAIEGNIIQVSYLY